MDAHHFADRLAELEDTAHDVETIDAAEHGQDADCT